MTHPNGQAKSAEAIQTWLISALAELLEIKPQQIDVQESLAYYGLNSVEAVTISGDLSDWLGRDISPNVVWDYPTIAAIAQYLASEPSEPCYPTKLPGH